MTMDVTSVSSKGQVVIPTKIRQRLGIVEGSKLVILTDGENVLLKPILSPKWQAFEALVKESQALARKAGLKKADLAKALRAVRHARRH